MARFLDETGLKALWEKVKAYVVGQLKGYATTDALAEVRTVADGAQTSVDNMAVAVVDGQLEVTDKEGVTTGYALGGLSEGDANALEALKSRMAMFELVKTADDAPEKATIYMDGKAMTLNYGKRYSLSPSTSLMLGNSAGKWSVGWNDFSCFMADCVTTLGGENYSLFKNCSKMTSVDTSGWDMGNVTSLRGTFNGCSALTSLDVRNWDTSKLTDLRDSFKYCTALTELDLSGWNLSALKYMRSCFSDDAALTVLDMSNVEVSNCEDFSQCFYRCFSLTTLIGTHTLEEVEAGGVVALKGLKVALDLSGTDLERASLLAVIKGLADLSGSTAQTLTLGTTLKAKLTEADIKIATDKGWTIA